MAQNRSRYVGQVMRDCPAKDNQGGENDEEDWSQGWPEASPDVSCSCSLAPQRMEPHLIPHQQIHWRGLLENLLVDKTKQRSEVAVR